MHTWHQKREAQPQRIQCDAHRLEHIRSSLGLVELHAQICFRAELKNFLLYDYFWFSILKLVVPFLDFVILCVALVSDLD